LKPAHRVSASLAGAVLLVALVVALSAWAFRQVEEAGEARKQAFILIGNAEDLLSALKDAETGQRGYALTGDDAFLEPYLAARGGVRGKLEELRRLTSLPESRRHLDIVAPLMEAKLAELAQVIELRRKGDMPAVLALVGGGEGKRLMDSVRLEMRALVELERDALAQHSEEFRSNMRRLLAVIVAACVLTLLLSLLCAYLVYRNSRQELAYRVHLETQRLLGIQEELNGKLLQAFATLQANEQKLAVTLSSIGDAVIATDAEGCVTLLNPVAERLTGWALASATGRPVEEVFRIVNKETRQPSTIPVKDTLASGTTQGLANHTVLIAADGSECDIADCCAPIRGHEGQVVGAVLVFRDVSEEYSAQQASRDGAAQIQAILNTVVDGIVMVRADGGIVQTANPAAERMFGLAAAEIIGQEFSLLIPGLGRDQLELSLEHHGAGNKPRAAGLEREAVGRRKDRATFPLEIAVGEMSLDGARYFTCILRDVTSRKEVEAQREKLDRALQETNAALEGAKSAAEKANRAKSEFLSSMSHELRSPLNAILGFAQLMDSDSPPATSTQKASIGQILHAGWYLLDLINEILDLAVIESGTLSLSEEPVSLAEVMAECRAMIGPQAAKRGIRLAFPEFDVPHYVRADRTRLKQVFINLLSNAIKYSKPDATVVVECAASGPRHFRISIRDTGAGLAPEKLSQLFQPFNRLGKENSTEEGTGIGLVMSKRLVELMGGVVGVESAVGVGSVFWFELGAASPPQLENGRAAYAAAPEMKFLQGAPLRTLLYVEDNPANLALVEQLVARRPNMCLLTAIDATLGIELARDHQPDVILMDINLPGISGIQALAILRTDPKTSHIPVLSISANAMPSDVRKGLEAGFFRYLTKPIRVDEFMNALEEALTHADAGPGPARREPMLT
jgi:PAS domain S-box-containing protein